MHRRPLAAAAALALFAAATPAHRAAAAPASTRQALDSLFQEWRALARPRLVDGVPDYGAAAMSARQKALPALQAKLKAIDRSGWSAHDQVDWYVVRAEMSGLDFDHRVLRPWANDPAFYLTVFDDRSDQPAREGPLAEGSVDLWKHPFPLDAAAAAEIAAGLRAVPPLLSQARKNLGGRGHDLWAFGAKAAREQARILTQLVKQAAGVPGPLAAEAANALKATNEYADWLDQQLPSKTAASGIGIANYDWYLKHVQLVPWTWREEVVLMERELARAQAFLALEERRNAGLPQLAPVASAEEHERRFAAGVHEYVAFLKQRDILTVRDWMEPALLARVGKFSAGPLEFFSEVDYRDPELMRTHGYHWLDLGRMEHEPNPDPIRRGALLFNIFNTRTEGNATGWEELMMEAGMLEAKPRSRELVYILLAERAARALGDLHMQANQLTLEQAAQLASDGTPRNWLKMSGELVRWEQALYLRQPGYGTSYIAGKIQIEKLIEARRRQQGDGFVLRPFIEEFDAAGLIPASLLRWELTGALPDDVKQMLADD